MRVLVAVFAAVAIAGCGVGGDFSAREFRQAVAADDRETVEKQAYRAAEQRSLIGLSPQEVRERLGEPERVGRRRRVWTWSVGWINDTIGPGDAGSFYVQFDRKWSAVIRAEVAHGF